MSTSNAIDVFGKDFDKKDYGGMAEKMIAALKIHGSDRVRDALNGISGFESEFSPYLVVALIDIFKGELSKSADRKTKAEYVYSVPFFCRPEEKTKQMETMSAAAQSVTRFCIKIESSIHHQIHFDHFDVDRELPSGGSNLNDEEQSQTAICETETDSLVPVIDTVNYDDQNIAIKLATSLQCSFNRLADLDDNEGYQKKAILDCLRPMLQFCGYDYKINNHPDFQFIRKQTSGAKKKNGVIMCGEAKEVVNLPQKPMEATLSAHLCRYGFGTRIARNKYKDKNLKPEKLRNVLNLSHNNVPKKLIEDEDRTMSEMVTQLLNIDDTTPSDIQKEMIESAKVVETKLKAKEIQSKDALNLWAATMQACEASLPSRKKFTVVMSARMMWFVKLDILDVDKCTVLISGGILIGKEYFTQKLIRFIMLADKTGVLDDSILNTWKSHFIDFKQDESQKDDKRNNKRSRPSSSADDSAEIDDEHKEDGSPKRRNNNHSHIGNNLLMTSKSRPSNIFRAVSTDNSSSSSPIKTAESPTQIIQSADDHSFTNKLISPGPEAPDMGNTSGNIKSIDHTSSSNRMTDEEQMMWQRAFTGLGNADMKYLHQDQYKVIVPYLCQLDERAELESLGYGRCGTVKKIRWNGGFAAMKEYIFQDEDDKRVPSDVYEHELKVFYRLEALWGRYVPRLLFRNPWNCRPSIGMEVGQPMDNDIDKWADEDKEKMRKTIAEIRNKGFKQNDLRGDNFVRLNSGYIAMIDFEDVVEISSSA